MKGLVEVWGVRRGVRRLDHRHSNTINISLYEALRSVIVDDATLIAADAIAWGSYVSPTVDEFTDSDYAGTYVAAKQGDLVRSKVGVLSAKLSGTFSFTGAKSINYFSLGRGYVPAAALGPHGRRRPRRRVV